jgi:hypothetical protein
MTTERAVWIIAVVMEALVHREICLRGTKSDVPVELLVAAFVKLEGKGRDTSGVRDWLSNHGVNLSQSEQAPYCRRANNQISAPAEALIRHLLDHGWTKTAIAETMRINRRVVIRVAREALSAQREADDK